MSFLDDVPVALWQPILVLIKTIVQLVIHREDPDKQREIMFEAAEKMKYEADRIKFANDPRATE